MMSAFRKCRLKTFNFIKAKKNSYIRFEDAIAFLASRDMKILFPKLFVNFNITIRSLLHAKTIVQARVTIIKTSIAAAHCSKIEILLISHASQILEEKENKGLWPDETLDFIFQA